MLHTISFYLLVNHPLESFEDSCRRSAQRQLQRQTRVTNYEFPLNWFCLKGEFSIHTGSATPSGALHCVGMQEEVLLECWVVLVLCCMSSWHLELQSKWVFTGSLHDTWLLVRATEKMKFSLKYHFKKLFFFISTACPFDFKYILWFHSLLILLGIHFLLCLSLSELRLSLFLTCLVTPTLWFCMDLILLHILIISTNQPSLDFPLFFDIW